MCVGVAISGSDLPTELATQPAYSRRLHTRGTAAEYRFLYYDRHPFIPIWRDGALHVCRWGNGRGQSRFLPRVGCVWMSEIEDGLWRNLEPADVVIPSTFALEKGVWHRTRLGMRGLVVPDEKGLAVCFVIVQPSSDYFRMMTRSDREPAVANDRDRV